MTVGKKLLNLCKLATVVAPWSLALKRMVVGIPRPIEQDNPQITLFQHSTALL